MKTFSLKLIALLVLGSVISCSDYVTDIDQPIDVITDGSLDNPNNIPFITTGVQARFAQTHDIITCLAGGLSDELIFDDAVPNATFPTYREIDINDIIFDNNSVDGLYSNLNEARFYADNLLERLDGLGTLEDATAETNARFWGNFVAGVSRFWLGAYFGETETEGGAPIDRSATIPQAQLYADAISRLQTALGFADAYQTKVVNSMIGKIHLLNGDYAAATTALLAGLEEGDAPFNSLHNNESANFWRANAGNQRAQFVVDERFAQYIADDSNEANRIKIEPQHTTGTGYIYYRQAEYPENGSPIRFISWEETYLMLAECALNGQANAGDALGLVNSVRAASSIDPLPSIDLPTLFVERDKELFTEGNRLLDQRRSSIVGWHIQQGSTYSVPSTDLQITWVPWQYMPITAEERNQNPNID